MKEFELIKHPDASHLKEYLLDEIEDEFDFDEILYKLSLKLDGLKKVKVYVVGNTPLVTTLVSYCLRNNIELTLGHFDDTELEYMWQVV